MLQVRVLQAYVNEQGVTPLALNYDFGLVTLASPAPSGTTTLAVAAGEGSNVVINLGTAGYPADKPSQTMWQVRYTECAGLSIYAVQSSVLCHSRPSLEALLLQMLLCDTCIWLTASHICRSDALM